MIDGFGPEIEYCSRTQQGIEEAAGHVPVISLKITVSSEAAHTTVGMLAHSRGNLMGNS